MPKTTKDSKKRIEPASARRQAGPSRWPLVVILFVVVAAVVVVRVLMMRPRIGDREVEKPRVAEPVSARPEPASPEMITAQTEARLREQTVRLDPRGDGWESEAEAELASKQLEQLGKLLSKPRIVPVEKLATFAAEDFSCDDLRPEPLEEILHDTSIRIRRSSSASDSVESRLHRGAAGLGEAIKDLVSVFDETSTVRCKFKLFRIEAAADTLVTMVYYSATAGMRQGRLEQNALWHCRWKLTPGGGSPRLLSIRVSDYEEAETQRPDARLADCTLAVFRREPCFEAQFQPGIDHWQEMIEKRFDMLVFGHHGLAVGDVNGDGLDDLYVCQPGALPNRLFVHESDGTARDLSAHAGVDVLDFSHSALLVDIDNDGNQDLIVSTLRTLLIFSNDGAGVFALRHRIVEGRGGYSLAAADYDRDGDLDLYVCRYYSSEGEAARLPLPIPYHDANNGGNNMLLRNDGEWQFADVTAQVGLNENNHRFSFAAAWEDYDEDGDPDLYVANDFGRNNLYQNERGHFRDVAAQAGVEDIASSMSVSWADYDRDGKTDLYVGNMFSGAGNRITYQSGFQPRASDDTRKQIQRHARGNSLFKNVGGEFRDVSEDCAVTMGRWAWTSLFADINSDGWEDILVANGFLTRKNPDDL